MRLKSWEVVPALLCLAGVCFALAVVGVVLSPETLFALGGVAVVGVGLKLIIDLVAFKWSGPSD